MMAGQFLKEKTPAKIANKSETSNKMKIEQLTENFIRVATISW